MMAHPPTDQPRAAGEHQPIAADAWEQRRERLTTILAAMADHAMQQATFRCPYKNRHDRCTAQFGCRNQRFPTVSAAGAPASAAPAFAPSARAAAAPGGATAGSLPLCAGDDKLDYRTAWDTGASRR